jgi:hypothetical protein
MDPQVGASFIPKKPLTGTVSRSRAGGFGIVILIALLLFIASLVSAGAAFLYERFLTASISSKNHSLELAQSAYEPGAIEDLSRLDSRINQARTVLQKHIAPSAIFAFLSTQTLERVRFTNFDYGINTDGSATLTLKGVGDSFSTIALQSDQLGASKVLKDIIFSDIAIDPLTGKVTFSVKANVDSSLILYSKTLLQNPADAGADATPSTPTP